MRKLYFYFLRLGYTVFTQWLYYVNFNYNIYIEDQRFLIVTLLLIIFNKLCIAYNSSVVCYVLKNVCISLIVNMRIMYSGH